MINNFLYKGYNVFLDQLFIANPDLEGLIFTSSYDSFNIKKIYDYKKPIIARLDGTPTYLTTWNDLAEYMRIFHSRKILKIPKKISNINLINPYIFNRYLARNAKLLIEKSNGIIFQSSTSKKSYSTIYNFDKIKIPSRIIYNGTKLKKFNKNINQESTFGFPAIVTSASEFRPNKRLKDTLKLVLKLSELFPKIKLHIVGNINKYELSILKNIINKNPEIFKFHGLLNRKNISYLLDEMHLQLHLSFQDACPNAVIEGMMSSLPIITPAHTGTAELLDIYKKYLSVEEVNDGNFISLAYEKIPKINIDNYIKKITECMENLLYWREAIYEIAIQKYEIQYIAKKYSEFIFSL